MKKLNISQNTILIWLSNGIFPNAKKTGRSWRIPQSDIEAYLNKLRDNLTVEEVSKRLNVHISTIKKWIRLKRFPNAELISNGWRIPRSDVEKILDKDAGKLTVKEVAQKLNKHENTILKWLKDGLFPNAIKTTIGWRILETDLGLLNKNKRVIKYVYEGIEYEFLWSEEKYVKLDDLIKKSLITIFCDVHTIPEIS